MSEEKDIVEKVKKITEAITKDYNQNNMANFLSSNEIEFEFEDQKYKVIKPTFAQKQKTYDAKNKKYIELLKNDDYMLEEDLKKLYFKKGIDIDVMEHDIFLLSKEYKTIELKLGEAVDKELTEKELKLLETELEKTDTKMKELSVKKTDYLEYAIESQVMIFEYSYLMYLISEKLVDNKWIKVWNTYEDKMEEPNESLVNTVTFHSCFLIRGEV